MSTVHKTQNLLPFLEKDGEELEENVEMMFPVPVGEEEDGAAGLARHPAVPAHLRCLVGWEEEVGRGGRLTGLQLSQQPGQVWAMALFGNFYEMVCYQSLEF